MSKEHRKECFVYMLRCSDLSIYTGWTINLDKRLAAHKNGQGAKYTRSRRPVALIRSWTCQNSSIAKKLEYRIKRLTRKQKETLLDLDQATNNTYLQQLLEPASAPELTNRESTCQ